MAVAGAVPAPALMRCRGRGTQRPKKSHANGRAPRPSAAGGPRRAQPAADGRARRQGAAAAARPLQRRGSANGPAPSLAGVSFAALRVPHTGAGSLFPSPRRRGQGSTVPPHSTPPPPPQGPRMRTEGRLVPPLPANRRRSVPPVLALLPGRPRAPAAARVQTDRHTSLARSYVGRAWAVSGCMSLVAERGWAATNGRGRLVGMRFFIGQRPQARVPPPPSVRRGVRRPRRGGATVEQGGSASALSRGGLRERRKKICPRQVPRPSARN